MNSAFLKTRWAINVSDLQFTATISLSESDGSAEKALQTLQDALELTRAVLQTERRATLAVHCLRKLGE